jgi:hypothetical protein
VTWVPRWSSTLTAGIPAIAYEGTTTATHPAMTVPIATGDLRTAHSAPTANSANGDLIAAAAPSSAPAARQRHSTGLMSGGRNHKSATPARPKAAASPSMCPLATISHSSSGFTDQSRCARNRIAGSPRHSRSSISTTAPKAIATHSFSQNVIAAIEAPPSSAETHSSAVATGP